jgi:hypothetical protein
MPGYRYRITVEPLTDKKGQVLEMPTLVFEAENHDEILSIVNRLQQREDLGFGVEKTAAFALGLKLFSETMMENRRHPLFAPLRTAFMDFMSLLKKGSVRARDE